MQEQNQKLEKAFNEEGVRTGSQIAGLGVKLREYVSRVDDILTKFEKCETNLNDHAKTLTKKMQEEL